MFYVKIPEPVQIRTPASQGNSTVGDPKKFIDWLLEVVLNDPRGADGGPVKIRRWQKLIEKFEKYCNPGDIVTVEDEDMRLMRDIVKAPQVKYSGIVTVQLLSFFEALTEAPEKDPRPPVIADNQDGTTAASLEVVAEPSEAKPTAS